MARAVAQAGRRPRDHAGLAVERLEHRDPAVLGRAGAAPPARTPGLPGPGRSASTVPSTTSASFGTVGSALLADVSSTVANIPGRSAASAFWARASMIRSRVFAPQRRADVRDHRGEGPIGLGRHVQRRASDLRTWPTADSGTLMLTRTGSSAKIDATRVDGCTYSPTLT